MVKLGGILLAAYGLAKTLARRTAGAAAAMVTYRVHPDGPWGPFWKHRRPPGLPLDGVRPCGESRGALPYIRSVAASLGMPAACLRVCEHLAVTESGAMLGRPANTFNILPKSQRGGAPLITAWGCYQWNELAWDVPRYGRPYAASVDTELRVPLTRYLAEWTQAKRAGASDLNAARAVRLWHRAPAFLRSFRSGGYTDAAWLTVPADHRNVIDRHISRM